MNILIIEDNDDHFTLVESAILETSTNLDITRCIRGEHAIKYLQARESETDPLYPSLIILDLQLVGMSGHDVLKAVKTHENWRRIPVVILSSSEAKCDMDAAYDAYANSYISKSSSYQELRKKLNQLTQYWSEVNCQTR